ncbi:MAG: methylmalonyl-CoA mutase family protein, partial [Candidatus Binataceae bacterium]
MSEANNPSHNQSINAAAISEARKRWEEKRVAPTLKRGPERREHFTTTSGIEIKREYNPEDLNGFDFLGDLGFPGEYPFTRGVQPTMYRGRLWTMRQYAGFGDAEESNRRYRYLFANGQTGLSVAFDLPTQMGRDADHPLVRGEVGRVGVSIQSIEDMETLLAELPLDKISTSMTINATASTLLALYLVAAERRGIGWDKLNGTIQNDILKDYIARGTYIYPPRGSMRIITDIFAFASRE